MKNTAIFLLAVAGILTAALFAARGTSRTASVEGCFAPEIRGVDYKWAYLTLEEEDTVLDSCLILENRFTLSGEMPEKRTSCRIFFRGIPVEKTLCLHPRQTLRLNIAPDQTLKALTEQHEAAIREALERLDSRGMTIPDSLWSRGPETGTPTDSL